jgi:branched-chain amino acid transport system permease protein
MGDMDLDPRPGHQREQEPDKPSGKRQRVETPTLTERMRAGTASLGDRYRALPAPGRVACVGLLIAFFAALPFMLPAITNQKTYYDSLLLLMGIGALLALGLNVVVGFAGLLDLGYVAFFAVGAYSYAFLSGAAKYSVAIHNVDANAASLMPHWQPYFWLFFPAAIIIALVTGVLLGAPTLRLRGDYLAIVTLGFGEIVRITALNLDGLTGGPQGVQTLPHPQIFGKDFGLQPEPYYWLILGIIVVWIVILRRLNGSRVGRAWAAIREDEVAASAMGIPVVRMKLWAFAIGASVASLAGVIFATKINYFDPNGFTLFNVTFGSVIILSMVVLGGMGGIAGPILGTALIIFLPERFRSVGDARLLLFGAALVLIMIVRPQGLLPSRRRAAELKGDIRDTTLFDVRQEAK